MRLQPDVLFLPFRDRCLDQPNMIADSSAMSNTLVHGPEYIGDVAFFIGKDNETYLAFATHEKLFLRQLKYDPEPFFSDACEYTLPGKIAVVSVVQRKGECISQLVIVTMPPSIYSLRDGILELLWGENISELRKNYLYDSRNIEHVYGSGELATIFWGDGDQMILRFNQADNFLMLYALGFTNGFLSNVKSVPRVPGLWAGNQMLNKRDGNLQQSETLAKKYNDLGLNLEQFPAITDIDHIKLGECLVWITRKDIVLALPDRILKVLDKKKRVTGMNNFAILQNARQSDLKSSPNICTCNLDEHRLLVGWDNELFLLCVDVVTNPPAMRKVPGKRRKIASKQKTATLQQFELIYLGPFTPAKWLIRLQKNLFLALSRDFKSFFFQLSSKEPFYNIVSICHILPSVPIENLEVQSGGSDNGSWKVECNSILFSQEQKWQESRTLLTLKEDCVEADEFYLEGGNLDGFYGSLWTLNRDVLVLKGVAKNKYLRLKDNAVERWRNWAELDETIIHAADDRVILPDRLLTLGETGVSKTLELQSIPIWGKVCKRYVAIVRLDNVFQCYDEELVLRYEEKLSHSEYAFFQAERNNDMISLLAAGNDNLVEMRLVDLSTGQCVYKESYIKRSSYSGVIKQMEAGFLVCLGCQDGVLTLLTLGVEPPMAPEELQITSTEEILVLDLPSNTQSDRIVIKSPSEVWIATIDTQLKMCKLGVSSCLRTALAFTLTSSGLAVLDGESRLKLVHFAPEPTTPSHCTTLRGRVTSFKTIWRDHHSHMVALTLNAPHESEETSSEQSYFVVTDIRGSKECAVQRLAKQSVWTINHLVPRYDQSHAVVVLQGGSDFLLGFVKRSGSVELVTLASFSEWDCIEKGEAPDTAKTSGFTADYSHSWQRIKGKSVKAGISRSRHVNRIMMKPDRFERYPAHSLGDLIYHLNDRQIEVFRVEKDFGLSKFPVSFYGSVSSICSYMNPVSQRIWIGDNTGRIYVAQLKN